MTTFCSTWNEDEEEFGPFRHWLENSPDEDEDAMLGMDIEEEYLANKAPYFDEEDYEEYLKSLEEK